MKDCSFTIEPGESVAVVGVSGCGKTTLVKLLLGLLRPSEGRIFIGGYDLEKVGARNVRAIVGAVMQDDQLFAGSIADNIAFFDGQHDLPRVEAAARLAAVHDEIAAMPMGYHTLIGDMARSYKTAQKSAESMKEYAEFAEERAWQDLLQQKIEAQRRFERSLKLEKTQTELVKRERARLMAGRSTTLQTTTIEQNFASAQIQRVRSQLALLQVHNVLKTWGEKQ